MDINEIIERRLEMMKRDEVIICPHCKQTNECDDYNYPVSYWGEDEYTEWECCHCEKTFWVEEVVTRTYKEYLGPESNDVIDKYFKPND